MIQGRSNFVYRINDENADHPTFVSLGLKDQYEVTPIHVDVNIVSNDQLDLDAFKAWRPEYANAEFILEDGKYICGGCESCVGQWPMRRIYVGLPACRGQG